MTAPIRLPSGVRDFLPRAAARRLSLAAGLGRVFEAWGYARIITPVFECADVLERGLGGDARAAAIRFVEPGTGEVVALRPDITAQVARLVATRLAEHEGPVRLCYEGAVYRLSGRLADEMGQREILQAGVELIDMPAPAGDAEVLAVAAAALATAGINDVRLDVGHVAPLNYVLGAIPTDDLRETYTKALAKKDRAKLRAVSESLPSDVQPLAIALGTLWGPALETISRAHDLAWPEEVLGSIAQLSETLNRFFDLVGTPGSRLTADFGDVRGFDYYTGMRFGGFADGAPDAVLRGGRYDSLIGRYGRPARATGFAIDVEALAQAQQTNDQSVTMPRGVAVYGQGAAALARALRDRSIRAVTSSDPPTPSWLSAAGLDAAILIDRGEVLRPDGSVLTGALSPDGVVTLLGGT